MCHQDLVRITSGVNSSSSISVTELEFVDYLIIKTLTQSNQKLLKQLLKGTSKNWILISFIEKPFFNQFMSVFAMKF